jgi:GNAT superfamily N-acetyltransferase
MLTIRPAAPEDAPLVLRFIRDLAEYEKLAHEVVLGEAEVREVLFGPAPRAFCDIAEWDGEPAGFCVWFYNLSTFWGRHGIYLEDLFVRPEHRGRGVGRALLAGLARRCVEQGLPRLDWAVLDWNVDAIRFYEGLGAQVVSDWRICRLTGEALQAMGGPRA